MDGYCTHEVLLTDPCHKCAYEQDFAMIAFAAEPQWVEMPREELRRLKLELSDLIGTRAKKMGMELKAHDESPELKLLHDLWQILNKLLN